MMVKEETNVPDWKKRVPYEESEAAYHKKHGKEAMPVKEAAKAPVEGKAEMARRAAGEMKAKRAATMGRMGRPSEAACDACGRVHTGSDRCEMYEYEGEKFHICGECIPPVHENPADFLAGKKGTMTEQELWEHCKK